MQQLRTVLHGQQLLNLNGPAFFIGRFGTAYRRPNNTLQHWWKKWYTMYCVSVGSEYLNTRRIVANVCNINFPYEGVHLNLIIQNDSKCVGKINYSGFMFCYKATENLRNPGVTGKINTRHFRDKFIKIFYMISPTPLRCKWSTPRFQQRTSATNVVKSVRTKETPEFGASQSRSAFSMNR